MGQCDDNVEKISTDFCRCSRRMEGSAGAGFAYASRRCRTRDATRAS
jgi:hypothetical protein